ncbi:hypothetical protein CLCR_06503 [Cladophialophora carrionii]|uniref:Uncharacterized protein n=1 Tax=Cladophialophora carrionii TaxID=86049 RepID=A0A1C1C9Z7_9EURO|nr:hypothetical protein CLCR_06503 [Cladophialophora carrionii]
MHETSQQEPAAPFTQAIPANVGGASTLLSAIMSIAGPQQAERHDLHFCQLKAGLVLLEAGYIISLRDAVLYA